MPTSAANTRARKESSGKECFRRHLATRRSSRASSGVEVAHATVLLGALGGSFGGRTTSRPVADARDGLDDAGLFGVALDFGAQARDVHVYVTARQIVRARRDGLGDLGTREGPAR